MGKSQYQTFPFLKLPLEIRNEIYRHLLCIKYTMYRSKARVSIKDPFEAAIKTDTLLEPTKIPVSYALAQLFP